MAGEPVGIQSGKHAARLNIITDLAKIAEVRSDLSFVTFHSAARCAVLLPHL